MFRGYIKGLPSRILSGGQYDGLMQKMGKRESAVGFAVYLDLLEQLRTAAPEYDVDTVVLYDDTVAPAKVLDRVDELASEGETVLALRALPSTLRCRRTVRMGKEADK